jgi:hypothetical protein
MLISVSTLFSIGKENQQIQTHKTSCFYKVFCKYKFYQEKFIINDAFGDGPKDSHLIFSIKNFTKF